eukprot:m51a1_g6389 hypothetical protein (159) ;mRNA; f:198721-199411
MARKVTIGSAESLAKDIGAVYDALLGFHEQLDHEARGTVRAHDGEAPAMTRPYTDDTHTAQILADLTGPLLENIASLTRVISDKADMEAEWDAQRAQLAELTAKEKEKIDAAAKVDRDRISELYEENIMSARRDFAMESAKATAVLSHGTAESGAPTS